MSELKNILKRIEERNADIATKPWIIRFDLTTDVIYAMVRQEIKVSKQREFDTYEEALAEQFIYGLQGLSCRIVKQTIGLPRAL
jgi:hypothetical protein